MNGLPKILLLGDYSNCQFTLATGLQKLGCDVTLISNGSKWLDCERDIDISRRPGKLGGLQLYYRLLGPLHRHLRGYDIVVVNDPNFVELRPSRLRWLFDRLRRDNGQVHLMAMCTDVPLLDMYEAPDCPIRYSEWFINGSPSPYLAANPEKWQQWHSPDLVDYQNYFYDNIDGAIAVLYEYFLSLQRRLPADKIAYSGIPIDLDRFKFAAMPDEIDRVKLFLGRDRDRMLFKGTDLLEKAARIVADRHPGAVSLEIVENRPFREFTELLTNSHIVLDQIYSYTPGTTALMAMAYGKNVVTGGEEDYYKFIGESTNRPIINAPVNLEELVETIDSAVSRPELLAERGRQSHKFVVDHNDSLKVARRVLDFLTRS